MRRGELWRKEYGQRPYLQHFDDAGLLRRFDDVVANAIQLTTEGRIGAVQPREGGAYWYRLLAHVKAEMDSRDALTDHSLVERSQLLTRADSAATAAISGTSLPEGGYLAKYNPAEFVRPMAERGKIRVSPATRYDDPSLDPAQQDGELRTSTLALPDEIQLRMPDGGTIEAVANADITWSATTDYYTWCLSSVLDARLFRQFGGEGDDACFLIRDPGTFLQRFMDGLRGNLPDWSLLANSVTYIDPVNPPEGEPNVYFAKHFRFTYQREVRVIAVPPQDIDRLDHRIWVELGPLDDVGELIVVPRNAPTHRH